MSDEGDGHKVKTIPNMAVWLRWTQNKIETREL